MLESAASTLDALSKRGEVLAAVLYLVRHGEAASSWGNSPDPGLSELGEAQAVEAAETLHGLTASVKILSSPLARARQTATPLEKLWGKTAEITSSITEIPSRHIPLDARQAWLMELMSGVWGDQSENLLNWRRDIISLTQEQASDAILFTHFMVINTIVGAARGNEKILNFRPDNGSITRISVDNGQLELIELGGEATTVVR